MSIEDIAKKIAQDPENASLTAQGLKPIFQAGPQAKICIIGQAPGQKAQESGIIFNDRSGDTLRQWLGVTSQEFYNPDLFAILPMDFYFQGKDDRGNDIPPRKDFAGKWHPVLLDEMPYIELFVLTGSYAAHYYLGLDSKTTLTSVVQNYEHYLPKYFPIIHPSGHNQIWEFEHPWFKESVVPDLQQHIKRILA